MHFKGPGGSIMRGITVILCGFLTVGSVCRADDDSTDGSSNYTQAADLASQLSGRSNPFNKVKQPLQFRSFQANSKAGATAATANQTSAASTTDDTPDQLKSALPSVDTTGAGPNTDPNRDQIANTSDASGNSSSFSSNNNSVVDSTIAIIAKGNMQEIAQLSQAGQAESNPFKPKPYKTPKPTGIQVVHASPDGK